MSYTDNDIKLVNEGWALVMKDVQGNGAFVLKTFLDKHDYYHKFKRFHDAPRDTIMDNPIFRNHAEKLIRVLDDVIRNLGNREKVKTLLLGLAQGHKKRGIQRIQFEQLKVVILDILKSVFKIAADAQEAWRKVFDAAFPIIYQGLEGK